MLRAVLLLLAATAAAAAVADASGADPLSLALQSLTFKHQSTVHANDSFNFNPISCAYLEPHNPARSQYSWASSGSCEYLFRNESGPAPPAPCNISSITTHTDMPGHDIAAVELPSSPHPGPSACAPLCCARLGCQAFVFATAPSDFMGCKAGHPCCYLKNTVASTKSSTVPDIAVGVLAGRPTLPPPPLGMRSAVPQGGVASGSVELRADGSMHEWTIVNQSPAGAVKFPVFTDAFFAASLGSSARALRTAPPPGVPGVAAMSYSGAYPMARLAPQDPIWSSSPASAVLYAYSAYHVGNFTASLTPAAVYTLVASASRDAAAPVPVSFFFNLPIQMEEAQARTDPQATKTPSATTAVACQQACQQSASCASWTFDPSNGGCGLSTNVPLNEYKAGATSGVKGTWAVQDSNCLTLSRAGGTGPAHGNMSLCASPGAGVRFLTGYNATDVWTQYTSGSGADARPVADDAPYGAVAVTASVPAGQTASLSIAMSWYFPHRDHLDQDIGNLYAQHFRDAADAGQQALAAAPATVRDIGLMHSAFFNSTLPDHLSDFLVNSLSHIRSMWATRDGRLRQWEAYDCVNIDSVHNDGERHIPYIMFFPDITMSKMLAWGEGIEPDGMIQEQLGCGCTSKVPFFDDPCGRVMSDVSSMYIVYALELLRWGNQTDFVRSLMPNITRAAEWQIAVSEQYGIPAHLVATYDILQLSKYPTASYNGIFHLTSMKACMVLADTFGNATLHARCQAALTRGQQALDSLLWVVNGTSAGHYAAVQGVPDSLMADIFYGQVLAYSVGLGMVVQDADKMRKHLASELEQNDTPFGLRITTGGSFPTGDCIWQMAPNDWATVSLRQDGAAALPHALNQTAKALGNWRSRLNDLWNVAGVAGADGNPYITSHYGYAMTSWHVPMALSGQTAVLAGAATGNGRRRGGAGGATLDFAPVLDPAAGGKFRLPVILVGVLGQVASDDGEHFELTLHFGSLTLDRLAVGSAVYPGPVTISAGQTVRW